MLQKIKNFFIKLFCFIFISAIWAISMASYAEGGAEINGILAFLLWLVNLIILFKVSAVVSAIGIGMWFNIAKFTMFKENIREISEEIRVGKRDILSIYMSM